MRIFFLLVIFLISGFLIASDLIKVNTISVFLKKDIKMTLEKGNEVVQLKKSDMFSCKEYSILEKKLYCLFRKKSGFFIGDLDKNEYTSIFDLIKTQPVGYLKKLNAFSKQYFLQEFHNNEGFLKFKFKENTQTPLIVESKTNLVHIELSFTNFQFVNGSIFLSEIKENNNFYEFYSKSIINGEDILIGKMEKQSGKVVFHAAGIIKYFGKEDFIYGIMDAFEDLVKKKLEFFPVNFLATHKVTASVLNVRSSASTTASVVTTAPRNSTVMLLEETTITLTVEGKTGKWVKIRLADGKEGYVFSGFLEKIK